MPTANTLLTIVLGPALSLCLGQCASGPALERHLTLRSGEKTVVAYQSGEALTLSLANRSALTAEQAIAARRADPNLKIVPDGEIQLLLDMFGALRYFDIATDVRDPNARAWLLVQQGGRTYVASGRSTNNVDIQRFANCMTAFTDVYNSNDNFSGSKMSAKDLEQNSREVNSSSKTIRSEKSDGRRP